MLTAAAKTAPKTRSATVFRRRHTSSANSRPLVSLRDEDDITGMHADVLLSNVLLRGQLVVLDRDARSAGRLLPEHDDAFPRGKLVQTAGHREHVEYGGAVLQLVAAGRLDLADDRHLHAVDLFDEDRHRRSRDVLGKRL